MMKICGECGKRMKSTSKKPWCLVCRSVCACGKRKDYRAAECLSCGMSRKAKAQWADPRQRDAIMAPLREAHRNRRTHLEDLTWESPWYPKQEDGRFFARYWGGDRLRSVYRYQWIWWKMYGMLPKARSVHHINSDCTDDRLENLRVMLPGDHTRLHARKHREVPTEGAGKALGKGGVRVE